MGAYLFFVKNEQLISHWLERIQKPLNVRVSPLSVKIHEKVKSLLAHRTILDRTRFDTADINIIFPKVSQDIVKDSHTIGQLHEQ
jgi:hypothetical protein